MSQPVLHARRYLEEQLLRLREVEAENAALRDGAMLDARIQQAVEKEREACAAIAEAQPFYPDTHTGMRQQWVKDEIAKAIRARNTP